MLATFLPAPEADAQSCAAGGPSRSVYFHQTDANYNPELQESKLDGGSHVFEGMLSDLITEPTWGITNWQNPVAYSSVDVSSFAWDGPLVTTGQSCLVDQTVPQVISFTYQYRRFTLNGATGVFFFPSGVDLDQLSCESGTEAQRTVALIFDNPSTSGGLHLDAYIPDQTTGTLCGSSVSGPVPGPLGKLALSGQAGLPSGVAHWVVCRMSGGPGPHALMLRLQHLLAARKAFVQEVPSDYCLILERSYLTGGSFGSAVAYAAQMIYPDLFDGAVGVAPRPYAPRPSTVMNAPIEPGSASATGTAT